VAKATAFSFLEEKVKFLLIEILWRLYTITVSCMPEIDLFLGVIKDVFYGIS
jgi:hypothetical protein